MSLSPIRRIGFHFINFLNSLGLIFRFSGHLVHSMQTMLFGEVSISWFNMVEILYYSGVKLVIPLIIICSLLSFSEARTVYYLLTPLNSTHDALPFAQSLIMHEILPLLIGFILCIQTALHMINTRIQRNGQTPEKIIFEHIWPIIFGLNLTSLLLFTYTIATIFISFYITFHYQLNLATNEFLLHVTSANTQYDLIYSAIKTLILCLVVSLAAGYYYYETAIRDISLRKAVSRIMTRGSFWLIVASLYMTFSI